MSIHVNLNHFTGYQFDRPVALSPHVVRLRPAPHCRTPIEAYSLRIAPELHFINWQQDPFGNHVARLVFPEKTSTFSVEVDLIADMTVINPFDFFVDESADKFPFRYDEQSAVDLAPYLEVKERGPLLTRWLAAVDRTPRTEEGLALIERAYKLSPDDPFILDSMGWANFRAGRLEDAEKYLRLALAERPDPEIAAHLGEVLWARGERARAQEIWQAQLKATPDNPVLLDTVRRLSR